jgi:cytochrome c-type biogenesis protein CcmE
MSDIDKELEQAILATDGAHEGSQGYAPPVESRDPVEGRGASAPGAKKSLGLLLVLLGVGSLILILVFSGIEGAAIYSVTTDELLSKVDEYKGRAVRVQGKLVKGSLRHRAEPCEYRFTLSRASGPGLDVRYPECVLPDTFRDVPGMDVEVTAEGALTDGGHLEATQIMAKCPSKYDMGQKAKNGEMAPHDAIGMPVAAPPIEE